MVDLSKLLVDILLPIESYGGAIPKVENQAQLIQRIEALGFDTVWARDIPLDNSDFKEVGQVFDPWIYLSYIVSLTKSIESGIVSVILPLRRLLHVAKVSVSLGVLFPNRFVMGVASEDRPVEYPAFNKPFELRSARVSEHIRILRELQSRDSPICNNDHGILMANVGDVIPKPVHKNTPTYVTGYVGRINLGWIAKNSDGWTYYPHNFTFTKKIVQDREEAPQKEG